MILIPNKFLKLEANGKKSLGDFPLVRRIGEPCACKRKADFRRGAVLPETPEIPRVPRVRSPPPIVLTKKNRPEDGFFGCVVEAAGIEPASTTVR
ncbi:hypothetical protein [Massilia sp. S19_KUP03_FR1]|uniref:hypothetical protein n=1 Tax=Massilia sp. S19_KUP03_FR1 TaxID=3025503 RepID=UPI002FCD47FB